MKMYFTFGFAVLLLLCFCSLNGYPQKRDKAAILGTVTIDEKGNVTVHSIDEQVDKSAIIPVQTGKFPVKADNPPENTTQAAKTVTSGENPVMNDLSSEKLKPGALQNLRSFTASIKDLHSQGNPDFSEQMKSTVGITSSLNEVNAGLNNAQKIYEANREQTLTSSPCELLSAGECILVRWYGEKEYFIAPTTNNIREYQERISAQSDGQAISTHGKFRIVDIAVTPAIKELLRSIDIIVPEFMNDQVKICIPENDFQFLQNHHIGYTINTSYGASFSVPSDESYGLKSATATASTLWSEGFEGTFPGTNYTVNDNNTVAGLDIWDDVSCNKHTGSWSIWCAGNGDKTDCSTYDNSMTSWVMKNSLISLSGYTGVNFTFWMKYAMENTNDVLKYWAHNGTSWTMIMQYTGSNATWAQYSFSLVGFPSFRWEFDFITNDVNCNYPGVFLDDMTVTGTPPQPNLDLVSGTGSLTVTGTNVSVGLTVVNNGTATAGASELGYYLSPDLSLSTTPNYRIGTDPVASLVINGTSAESLSVNVSEMSIPCGTYYVFFFIDHLYQVTEYNENDNIFYWSSPPVVIPCMPNLDLASGTSSLSVTGTSINLAVTAVNNGSATAGASKLGYYLSPDASLTTTPNYLIGTDDVPSLGVGGTSGQNLVLDVSAVSVPCGTYYVFFYFDHLGQVTESNETDNFFYFSSPMVTIPCVPNLTRVSGLSSISVSGTNVTIGLTVINNGAASAGASELGYYLSADNSFATTPNYLIGTDAVPALVVGGTSAQTHTVNVSTIIPLIPCGTYYVFYHIDRLGQVTESNENDNTWYFTSTLVTVPSQPNLTYQSGTSSITISGTTVTLGYTAINNGNCPSVACSAGYYLSPDISLTTTPNYFIGYTSMSALAAGGTSGQSFTKDVSIITPAIPCGTYYVFFDIDYLNQVAESNENDNAWYFTSPQVTVPCCPVVSISNVTVGSSAGTTLFAITSSAAWTASSNQAWCTVSPSSGTGNATVTVNYTANTTCTARVATITVSASGCNPVTATVTQVPCTLSVSPTARSVSSAAGSTTFALSTTCAWTASSNQAWCTISPSSGIGAATITANYSANTSCTPRIATITFSSSGCNPYAVTVTQAGCTISVSPADQPVSSAAGTTSITVSGSCAWTASSNQAWCVISPASGSGSGTITANYTANTSCIARTATISVSVSGCSPVNVTVTQAGCIMSLSQSSFSVPCAAGSVNLVLTGGCVWQIASNAAWCTVSPSSGTGGGTVVISYLANATASPRTATLTITLPGCNPGAVTVTQAACACTLAVSPANQDVPGAGGSANFTVTAQCAWTAVSNAAWCTISPASGTADGTITATCEANGTTIIRTATVTITAPGASGSPKTVTVIQQAKNPHFVPVGDPTSAMNINIVAAKYENTELEAGDEIGIFDGNVCVGAIVLTQSLGTFNDADIAFAKAYAAEPGTTSGFTPGHTIHYKIWDYSAQTEYSGVSSTCYSTQQTVISCSPFEVGGTSYVALTGMSTVTLDLSFPVGWRIFSFNCIPAIPDMKTIMQPLITSKCLVKVQDENGNSLEDMGMFGGWTDNIGVTSPSEGYKIKVSCQSQLMITGAPVALPYSIPLKTGWNIIGYPRQESANAMTVVQELINRGTLVKVQDEQGNSIEDLGLFGGWTNNIGNFNPGKGYKVKVTTVENLNILSSYPKSVTVVPESSAPVHFRPAFTGNGVDHMNINLVNIPSGLLEEGDEIGVFDGDLCVGSKVFSIQYSVIGDKSQIPNPEIPIRNPQSAIRNLSVPVSASDQYGSPGFTEGNAFSIKVWKKRNSGESSIIPEILKGTSTFLKHESTIVSLEKYAAKGFGDASLSGLTEVKCYPNPFNDRITIEVKISGNSKMRMDIINQTGQMVKEISAPVMVENNWYSATWDGTGMGNNRVPTGIYYLRVMIDEDVIIRKIAYSK